MHLYIHIPFCQKKCEYCAFSSISGGSALFASYKNALMKEIATFPKRQLHTLFLGGGTPTALPQEILCELLFFLKKQFDYTHDAEISVEVNPGTVDLPYLIALESAGVNRLSIGVQSFHDSELTALGRIHSAKEARQTIKAAQQTGISNISLDLMYGLPEQSPALWRSSLYQAIALKPAHLSLYQLTPEKGTPLFEKMKDKQVTLPKEEEIEEMDEISLSLNSAAGYEQYEISNFSLPGHQCQHNRMYWRNEEWYAAGAAAVSYLNGKREIRADSPKEYIRRIENGKTAVTETEQLDHEARFRETIIMGLRMNEGVNIAELHQRFTIDINHYYGTILTKLIEQRFLIQEKGAIRLSKRGRAVANQIMATLV